MAVMGRPVAGSLVVTGSPLLVTWVVSAAKMADRDVSEADAAGRRAVLVMTPDYGT
jgi:hypothetical protein